MSQNIKLSHYPTLGEFEPRLKRRSPPQDRFNLRLSTDRSPPEESFGCLSAVLDFFGGPDARLPEFVLRARVFHYNA